MFKQNTKKEKRNDKTIICCKRAKTNYNEQQTFSTSKKQLKINNKIIKRLKKEEEKMINFESNYQFQKATLKLEKQSILQEFQQKMKVLLLQE